MATVLATFVVPASAETWIPEAAANSEYALTRPADFKAFWRRSIAELAEEEAELQYDSKTTLLTYAGIDGQKCAAFYLPPARGKVAMAIVHIREVAYVPPYLSEPDLYAHLVTRWQPLAEGDTAWTPTGLPDSDEYCFRRAVLNICQLIELFVNQPDVLTSQVGIFGEGLGAGVALAVAALMPERVRFVVAYEPLPAYHYLPDGQPAPSEPIRSELLAWEATYPHWVEQMRLGTSYCDVVNFAPDVRVPTLVILGEADTVAIPESVEAIYSHITGWKQLICVPGLAHEPADTPRGWEDEWRYWIAHPASPPGQYQLTWRSTSRTQPLRANLPAAPRRAEAFVPGLPVGLSW